jgi:orotate phosphoribosyltransferase
MSHLASELASIALDIGAIELRPKEPFTWVSGYRMPIYNDNRLLLGQFAHRRLVAEGFAGLMERHELAPDVIAGTATAGIPFGTTLADRLQLPFIYIRSSEKGHGREKRIEGVLNAGESAVLVEDLISTGGSSVSALKSVREAGGKIDSCVAIFSYGFSEAAEKFRESGAKYYPLFTLDTLIEVALSRKFISSEDAKGLEEWRSEPFLWGEKRGFPKANS